MTALEAAILEVLRSNPGAHLSSTEINNMLPEGKRPKGKNSTCLALMSLVMQDLAVRHGNGSKKFSRYAIAIARVESTNIYNMWPFVARMRS